MPSNLPDNVKMTDLPGYNAVDLTFYASCYDSSGGGDEPGSMAYATYDVARHLNRVQQIKAALADGDVKRVRHWLDTLDNCWDDAKKWGRDQQTEPECGYEGEVEGQVDNGTVVWTCPKCGVEHEDEVDDWFEDPRIAEAEFRKEFGD